MHILCVAEKPSAAKQIAGILSQGRFQTRPSPVPYIKNYDFDYSINNRNVTITMTSLIGHIMCSDFPDEYRGWHSCRPDTLFDAPVIDKVIDKSKDIARNLKDEVRKADTLFIWTDCDREGEAIGFEVTEICRSIRRNIQVWRARFSAMQPVDLHRAAQQPTELDMRQVNAVKARSELDLRTGAAFTRLLTLKIRDSFFSAEEKKLLSYGSCQFPTLGFVVDRYLAVQNFVPEKFWKLDCKYTPSSQPTLQSRHVAPTANHQQLNTTFNWKRNRLFDRRMCFVIYDRCIQNPVALVTRVIQKMTSKRKPLPLTTIEMQKTACRVLRMTSDQIMTVAEDLYTKGFISYPRTETDQFDGNFNFQELIAKQSDDPAWGVHAQGLLNGGFETPRSGRSNDKAHPPIHPTGAGGNLTGNDRRVYEFIARSFLAACSKDAKGSETVVEIDIAEEMFDTKGLVVLERNYLDIYTYDKWSASQIPNFQQNQTFIPSVLDMVESTTTAPEMLTEVDLIGLMEKNEIGTDATIHEHIKKILEREYVFKQRHYFHPSPTGIALVLGYDEIGFDLSLTKPFLRREMEADLKRICNGERSRDTVVQQSLIRYRDIYTKSTNEFDKLIESFRRHVGNRGGNGTTSNGNPPPPPNDGGNGPSGGGPWRPGGGGGGGGNGPSPGGGGGWPHSGSDSNQTNGRATGNTDNPKCNCGNPSRIATVQKEGPNKGRTFYRCGDGIKDCGYFAWTDEPPRTAGPNCDCNKPSVSRTVTKEGQNHGRTIFICALPQDDNSRCNFFAWEDEASNPPAANSFTHRAAGPNCDCNKPSVSRTVIKEGQNHGRIFFSCALPQDDSNRCNFFAWEDDGATTSSSTTFNPPQAASSSTSAPICGCGQPAIQRRVIKEGANKGRLFYKCATGLSHENGGCGFFEFQDEPPSHTASSATQSFIMNTSPTTMKTYRNAHEMGGSTSEPRKTCNCGLIAVSKKITKADSVNRGKMFWTCPKESKFSRCNYFELTEDTNVQYAAVSGGSTCYQCGKPGHYASACPNSRNR
ncbi:DNA topoisomerase [Umbelopsis sp. AD052]|nr:DNA topoisomerase [Umbelopsis sp. AD052]